MYQRESGYRLTIPWSPYTIKMYQRESGYILTIPWSPSWFTLIDCKVTVYDCIEDILGNYKNDSHFSYFQTFQLCSDISGMFRHFRSTWIRLHIDYTLITVYHKNVSTWIRLQINYTLITVYHKNVSTWIRLQINYTYIFMVYGDQGIVNL
jgi:hypothetical protein